MWVRNPSAKALGAVASAAGPAGLALTAFDAAARIVTGSLQTMSRQISTMGDMAVAVAGNDGIGAFRAGVKGVQTTLEQIPIVGQVMSAGIGVWMSGFDSMQRMSDALVARAHQIAQFSGPTTAAFAEQRVAMLRADIREAQAMGPVSAELVRAQTEQALVMRQLLLPLKKLETYLAIGFTRANTEVVKQLTGGFDLWGKLLTGHFKEFSDQIRGLPDEEAKRRARERAERKSEEAKMTISQLYALAHQAPYRKSGFGGQAAAHIQEQMNYMHGQIGKPGTTWDTDFSGTGGEF